MIITGLRIKAISSRELDVVITPRDGALVSFAGVTRADGELVGLIYEAWESKAAEQLQKIAEQATSKWALSSALALHCTGRVEIGEISVLCAASAPHRADAFEACRYLIDEIKTTAAIWKCEEFGDGKLQWVGVPERMTSK